MTGLSEQYRWHSLTFKTVVMTTTSIPFDADQLTLAVDSHCGVYAPQIFAQRFHSELTDLYVQGKLNPQTFQDVLDGPDNEFYWDSWLEILDNAVLKMAGKHYAILQSEDIWFIPANMEYPEDWF